MFAIRFDGRKTGSDIFQTLTVVLVMRLVAEVAGTPTVVFSVEVVDIGWYKSQEFRKQSQKISAKNNVKLNTKNGNK